MKVYLDVNIILDWALQRKPFYQSSRSLIELVERKELIGLVSPLGIANAYYFVRKEMGKPLAHEFLQDCQQLFKFIDNPSTALAQAIDNPYKDFEDDLHFYSAIDNQLDAIVTRNVKDFAENPQITIITPDELLYQLGY
ncbi:type II toxin-antitoxin system VapC family toxin [Faucicola mancuniensis]|uniref:type II toxin-antitoxin system VapC family toxin n=1 Tax=Faucicola mancuniensis TaxID=1309795 RepID=UPI0039773E9B